MTDVLKKLWLPVLVGLLVAAAATWLWTRQHRELLDARQQAEAAELKLKNQIVENQETRRQLQGSVEQALRDNQALRAAYDQAKQAAPDARPASLSRLTTGPVAVVAVQQQLPAPTPPRDPGPDPEPAPEPDPEPDCAVRCEAVVLRAGDRASVQVDLLELETSKGSTLVVGTAEVFREDAVGRVSLMRAPFRSSLSNSSELAAPPEPRWGASVDGLCTALGCGLGISALLPPWKLPLLGWRVEGRVGVFAGPALGASAGLGVRW